MTGGIRPQGEVGMNQYDLVITGGRVIDPASGGEGRFNIGIRGGHISTLTLDPIDGQRVIDASGLVVAPGFIDMHNHVDGMLHAGRCMARMGVTTVIGGNCGLAMTEAAADVGRFLEKMDHEGFPVNHGLLVGAQDLRKKSGVMGPHAPADGAQLMQMVRQAEEAMQAGALGVSFGLAIAPGTSKEEVVGLFKAAARRNRLAAVHPRFFGPGLPGLAQDAVAGEKELIDAARDGGARLQISHLSSQLAWRSRPYDALLKKGLALIEEAREEGVDVMADCYPYSAWCMYPAGALLDVLLLPEVGRHMGVDISMVEVAAGPHKGERLTGELFLEIKRNAPKTVLVGHTMKPDLVDRIFLSSAVMVASDGVFEARTGIPSHPRGAGAFPKVLRHLVRETGMLSLQEALYKMTWLPARRFGLEQKGRIAVGADADLAIFDPDVIADLATYHEPDQGVGGLAYVFVNGRAVVDNGLVTEALPGRAVRGRG